MVLKIFRGVWFISMMVVLANLLYVYAGLPEEVIVNETNGIPFLLDREVLFYGWLALLGVVNVMIYIFTKSIAPSEDFRTWFTGLIITLNTFFIIGFSFIGLYNSSENFDFSRIGFVLYFGIGLVGIWLTGWPVFLLYRKLSSQ